MPEVSRYSETPVVLAEASPYKMFGVDLHYFRVFAVSISSSAYVHCDTVSAYLEKWKTSSPRRLPAFVSVGCCVCTLVPYMAACRLQVSNAWFSV